MGLYNFQPRFAPFILDGRKTHTIRSSRTHPDKPGNTLHLYTGLRTKRAKLLMRAECVRVENIAIRHHAPEERYAVVLNDVLLDLSETNALAQRDGFSDFREMLEFWKGRLPFFGQIVHWRKP